jgi:secondary thiamine-phosphate synthase enzyme
MRQAMHQLTVSTARRGLAEITTPVCEWVRAQSIGSGLLTLFCQHTSASLLVQENASPEVRADLERFYETLAPEDPSRYAHDQEGPDDMPAHLRTALGTVQLSIPVLEGRPALGTWQGIFLFEHRRSPHTRRLMLHLLGE